MNLTSGTDLFVNLSISDTVNVLFGFPEPLSGIRKCSRLYSDAELAKVSSFPFLTRIVKLYSEGDIGNSRLGPSDSRSQHMTKSSEPGAVELMQMLWLGVVLTLSLSVTVYCWPLRETVKKLNTFILSVMSIDRI